MSAGVGLTYSLWRCPQCGVTWAVVPVPDFGRRWAVRRARLMVEALAVGFQVAPYVLPAAQPYCPVPQCMDAPPLAVVALEAVPTPAGWVSLAPAGETVGVHN